MLAVWHCFSTTTWTSAQKILQNVGNRIRESVTDTTVQISPFRGDIEIYQIQTKRAVRISFRKFILGNTEQKCALVRCVTRHRESRDANTRVPSAISRIPNDPAKTLTSWSCREKKYTWYVMRDIWWRYDEESIQYFGYEAATCGFILDIGMTACYASRMIWMPSANHKRDRNPINACMACAKQQCASFSTIRTSERKTCRKLHEDAQNTP